MPLSDDHVDLIVTAALQWHILSGPPVSLLSVPDSLSSLDGSRAGSLITEHSGLIAAAYTFRQVNEPLAPMEVLKACHAALHACGGSAAFGTSVAHTLITQIAWAATIRLPGYAEAPWEWRRHPDEVLAICSQASPADIPLEWVNPSDVTPERWARASCVLVVDDALPSLAVLSRAGTLTSRAGVYALTFADRVDPSAWSGIADHVLHWPECEPWLTDLIGKSGASD